MVVMRSWSQGRQENHLRVRRNLRVYRDAITVDDIDFSHTADVDGCRTLHVSDFSRVMEALYGGMVVEYEVEVDL